MSKNFCESDPNLPTTHLHVWRRRPDLGLSGAQMGSRRQTDLGTNHNWVWRSHTYSSALLSGAATPSEKESNCGLAPPDRCAQMGSRRQTVGLHYMNL